MVPGSEVPVGLFSAAGNAPFLAGGNFKRSLIAAFAACASSRAALPEERSLTGRKTRAMKSEPWGCAAPKEGGWGVSCHRCALAARKSLAAFLCRSLGLSVSLRAAGSLGSALKTTATKQKQKPAAICLKETVYLASSNARYPNLRSLFFSCAAGRRPEEGKEMSLRVRSR